MAGVVAGSKHRSSARGRFAYLNISDPFGIFEAMIFDEALITSARDILVDGSIIALECLIRKDEGGIRILVRDVKKLDDFINTTKAQDKDFEDIKKQATRNYKNRDNKNSFTPKSQNAPAAVTNSQTITTPQISQVPAVKRIYNKVEIIIKNAAPIPAIKTLLESAIAKDGQIKSKITFFIMEGGKVMKIELPSNFVLDNSHIPQLKATAGVIDVEFA